MNYQAVCPECKNEINFDREDFKTGDHFECGTCGITLEARAFKGNEITELEIVEMEK